MRAGLQPVVNRGGAARTSRSVITDFLSGDAGNGASCEKEFTRLGRQGEVYTGTRFFNGDRALVVKRWLHRVDEDASGLTFVEPGTDC